jgi:saccharopine dehydrogenase (NAD+, L-lysine-forming)
LLIGAGAQGGPCASILARDKEVQQIILGDIDLDLANKVKNKIRSDKICTKKIDASNFKEVEEAAQGVNVIITLTLTSFNYNIMQAALSVGAHYVDTSFGEASMLDIRAKDNLLSQMIENRQLEFDAEFKNAGLTALVGCGASPGVVNILARYACDKLDRVDQIRIRFGRRTLAESTEVVDAWAPTWSPFRALWGYAVEPTVFENGRYRKYPIFSGHEVYPFLEPVGPIPLVLHQHQEPISLPYFIGKGIKNCDFKYTIDKAAGTIIKTGFANSETVEVKGLKVAPLDVLLALVRRPVETFLIENETTVQQPLSVIGQAALEITGSKAGSCMEYKIFYAPNMYEAPEEKYELYRKFGASNIYVSLPAIVGAKMCASGLAERGLIAPECLDSSIFLKIMAEMGAPLKFREIRSREVEISKPGQAGTK